MAMAASPHMSSSFAVSRSHSSSHAISGAGHDLHLRLRFQPLKAFPSNQQGTTIALSASVEPKSAEESINLGLEIFKDKAAPLKTRAAKALNLFNRAKGMAPNDDEMRAALYNGACCDVQLGNWDDAADALRVCINDYDLKFSVLLSDPDMAPFRERREFDELGAEVRGGNPDSKSKVRLRAEARNPFRFSRMTVLGGLDLGAFVGLIIITAKLVGQLANGGAPAQPLIEGEEAETIATSLQNFAINLVAVLGLSYVLKGEFDNIKRDEDAAEREESVGTLQVKIGKRRVVPLSRLRQSARIVVLYGPRGMLSGAVKDAKRRWASELKRRGVVIVQVPITGQEEEDDEESRGFASSPDEAEMSPMEAAVANAGSKGLELDAVALDEWRAFFDRLMSEKDMNRRDGVYLQLNLDGAIRVSGVGMPSWDAMATGLSLKEDWTNRMVEQ
ncbi:hypothetical protein PPROV_001100900 [Pycnococcus provasolii]|uniref:Protein LOW PSII ACCUMULATION 1, chloroplastic n=1 Tax=Pycnococcus provasolii TaxID=41880 RepID=A0A830I3J0_9CHLO|nr:hypothetical protein PPROV_001100900 [Pycnococcus provasolii]